MTTLGEKIKSIRNKKGLTREEFARLTGTTSNNIYQLESGRRKISLSWLEKIAKIFLMQPSELLEQKGDNELKKNERRVSIVSSNQYPIKDEYSECAIRIANKIIDHDLYSVEEKGRILFEIYKIVYDFYENQEGAADFMQELEKKIVMNQEVLKFFNSNVLHKPDKPLDKNNDNKFLHSKNRK